MVKLSVLIPCYNELTTIQEIVRRVCAVELRVRVLDGKLGLPTLPDGSVELLLDKEVIIVDDGSVDGTRDLLPALAQLPGVWVYYHERNMGKGAAVRTAIEQATGEIMLVQDADLEYDPRDYPALVQPILEGRSKAVYGSRFLGGPRKAMFFSHMLGNKLLTLFTNILFDTILSDMETCYKVFTREIAQQLRLKSHGWGFDPEITAKILKRGYRIYEVPISYTGREYTEGKKIDWRDGLTVMWTLLKYRLTE
ncbi:MAG: Undecaprenyl-phosphate mannosyltransferase [Chloroflexota bacterium]|nr:Undecaprenyl-phosphate mannosyltransferase [Chloroflexota bacterium]